VDALFDGSVEPGQGQTIWSAISLLAAEMQARARGALGTQRTRQRTTALATHRDPGAQRPPPSAMAAPGPTHRPRAHMGEAAATSGVPSTSGRRGLAGCVHGQAWAAVPSTRGLCEDP